MKHLAFMDLETTGLSADKDVILEAALVLTDPMGEKIDSISSIIHHSDDMYLAALGRVFFSGQDNIVNDMHQRSGLWDDWNNEEVPHMSPMQFSAEAMKLLIANDVDYQSAPLAGNSIGSLDRPFIMRHMPDLDNYLSYRNFDISTFKMYMMIHRPDVADAWKELSEDASGGTQHRALDDCMLSISEYVYYMNNFERRRKKK